MKCRSWSCRGCVALLVALAYFLCGTKLIVNAESAETILSNEKNNGYQMEAQVVRGKTETGKVQVTHTAPEIVDGIYFTILSANGENAYCLQASVDSPEEAVYEVEQELSGQDSVLNKVMYYAYGNPGYREELWISDCPGDTMRAYLRSHMVLSYVYDSANTLKRELIDDSWKGWWEVYIQEALKRIENEPDIPDTSLTLEKTEEKAFFDTKNQMQRTESNQLYGDSRNKVEFSLPPGISLVNETRGTTETGTASIWGGDLFYLMADLTLLNEETTVFENLQGSIQNDWITLVVQTGEGTQDLGYGVLYGAETTPLSLSIEWLPFPEVPVEPEPEEPEIEEPEIEEPEPEIVPKTGDHSNLIVLILNLLLSCFIVLKYGRITNRK